MINSTIKRYFSAVTRAKGELKVSRLSVESVMNGGVAPPHETLVFGQTFTDHMLECDWTERDGWLAPVIRPFQHMSLHPAVTSLHYGLQCFEGMKAYKDKDDQIRMFRPGMNMTRMNSSMKRMLMPRFDEREFLECIKELLRMDHAWIPRHKGYSLYVRPTAISTHPGLGVGPPASIKMFVILSPVGPYYKSGFAPVKLYADPQNVRAWPGGTGNVKCGGNYAMSIDAQVSAAAKGYAQVLWLFGEDMEVTEVGTMNQFFLWDRRDGKRELVTAPLDGTILPGVTRDSILNICREWGEFEVSERKYTLHEVLDALEEGRIVESFGAGTAAIVSPVNGLYYDGTEYEVPLDKENPDAKIGRLTERLVDRIMQIQYGEVPDHPWSVVVDRN